MGEPDTSSARLHINPILENWSRNEVKKVDEIDNMK